MTSSDSFVHHVKFNTVCVCPLSQNIAERENSVHSCELSSFSPQSQPSGWGNADSRKTYACLTSLVDDDIIPPRKIVSMPIDAEGWGYFVDTKDS